MKNQKTDMKTDAPTRQYKCVLCNRNETGWGNNPDPISTHGECCDNCNLIAVIPARMGRLNLHWLKKQRQEQG